MTTATQCLSNLNCEVHAFLVEDGRCTCSVVAKVPTPGPVLVRPKQRYTIMSDEDCHYYLIPTEREAEFKACNCEDFSEYRLSHPQGAMIELIFSHPSVN
jgi:hypothetical protein